jgi:hypothetical protein
MTLCEELAVKRLAARFTQPGPELAPEALLVAALVVLAVRIRGAPRRSVLGALGGLVAADLDVERASEHQQAGEDGKEREEELTHRGTRCGS